MLTLTQWACSFRPQAKPWLILGKGPSFSRAAEADLDRFHTCALNHVVRELPVTVAHAIDLDVVLDCGEAIERNARFLLMPLRPHVAFEPSDKTLYDLTREIPLLQRLARANRLVGYDLSSSRPHGDAPVIQAKFFSAEAALDLLATCGVKEVRSLGVDGGDRYSPSFDDLANTTRLANQHDSFDLQFAGMARTILRTGVFYAPLHVEAPARVFVGADPAQRLAVPVLEYSIKKHSSLSVEVERIDNADLPVPRDPRNRSRTGFSFARFRIPELCARRGKAIYLDADMLVFGDVARVWTRPLGDAHLLHAPTPSRPSARFSAMLLDCERLAWDPAEIVRGLDDGRYRYEELMGDVCVVEPDRIAAALPPEWNHLDHYDAERTSLIHFTNMPTQPWVSPESPHRQVWYDYAREALEAGYLTRDDLYSEVDRGHVSPDLPRWLGLPDPPGYRALRRSWVPPYRRFAKSPEPKPTRGAWLPAGLRRPPAPAPTRAHPAPPDDPWGAAYEAHLRRSQPLAAALFEHRLRGAGPAQLLSRLRLERNQALARPDAEPRDRITLVVLVEQPPGPRLATTLQLWSLQSLPQVDCVLLARGAVAQAELDEWLGRQALSARVIEPDWSEVGDSRFVVFARPGDAPHPSLATVLSRQAKGHDPDVVTWHTQREIGPERFALQPTPPLEPLTLWSTSYQGLSFAAAPRALARFPGDAFADLTDNDGHALLVWLSRAGLRWRAHSDYLSVLGSPPARAGRESLPRYRALFEGDADLTLEPTPSGGLPYRLQPRRRATSISVVIPFRDRPDLTCRCLDAVLAQELEADLELVLVDNQSCPDSLEQVRAHLGAHASAPEVRWVHYDHPFNHSEQCARGVEASHGEVLLFLNNDARLVSAGALQALADWSLVPGIATAGARLTTEEGGLVSAGIRLRAERRQAASPPVEESTDLSFAYSLRETAGNSFACAAVARATWDRLGPLDAAAFPNGYNDAEWCLRASAAGLRHAYLGPWRVVHQPGTTRTPPDETPQILELWRRYTSVLAQAASQLTRVVRSIPSAPAPPERSLRRVVRGLRRRLAQRLRR